MAVTMFFLTLATLLFRPSGTLSGHELLLFHLDHHSFLWLQPLRWIPLGLHRLYWLTSLKV